MTESRRLALAGILLASLLLAIGGRVSAGDAEGGAGSEPRTTLEFVILATTADDEHADEIAAAKKLAADKTVVIADEAPVARWLPTAREDVLGSDEAIDADGLVTRKVRTPDGKTITQCLSIVPPESQVVTGADFDRVTKVVSNTGRPAVAFTLDESAAKRMQMLTASHRPRAPNGTRYRLAIVLGGVIHSAPTIRSTISSAGQIEGAFTDAEVDALVRTLSAD